MSGLEIFVGWIILCIILLFLWLLYVSRIVLPKLLKRELSKYGFTLLKVNRPTYRDEPLPFRDKEDIGDFIFLGEDSANQDYIRRVYFLDADGTEHVVIVRISFKGLKRKTEIEFNPGIENYI